MRTAVMILALAACAGQALAWDDDNEYQPQRPRSSSSYDANTGNMYNTNRHADGSSDTYGNNPNTGSQWNSHTDRNGNARGTDSDGNMWQYNKGSNTYFNYGTGKMCTGSGRTRICN